MVQKGQLHSFIVDKTAHEAANSASYIVSQYE